MTRIERKIIRFENRMLAMDLIEMAKVNPKKAEFLLSKHLDYLCTVDGLKTRVLTARRKAKLFEGIEVDERD